MSIDILDPTHESQAASFTSAPRPESLAGATVGFISNGKEGTKGFFGHLERLFRERLGVADVEWQTKANFSAPADAQIIAAASRWKLVVTGLGD